VYDGLKTADRLKENYLFIPEKVKEVYLAHLLGKLEGFKVGAPA
jgi:ATP-dependent RNA helicase DDX49/DBP8